jgi:predicted nucleic acid-binding protein
VTFLVDANVLSEPTKPAPNSRVIDWLRAHEGNVVLDAIVLGELYAGILRRPAGRRRAQLEHWFESVIGTLECLPWDGAVSRRWAKLVVQMKRRGRSLPLLDSMIAATALEHGLTVATRNVRDFEGAGVSVIDPFA